MSMNYKLLLLLLLVAFISCADGDNASTKSADDIVIDQSVLDSATVLVEDSSDYGFEKLPDALMLVYNDSLLIANRRHPRYDESLISVYDMKKRLHHLADYIPFGSEADEMMACGITITGNDLFVCDSWLTGRYCSIQLDKPLIPSKNLHLYDSGVEERGAAIIPFRQGLLVENPQCYDDDEAGIHNEVPRLLYYEGGKCLTQQEPVEYQVADINTGADIHYNAKKHRACFVSHLQPFVELYNDSLKLIHRISVTTKDDQHKISVGAAQKVMHQKRDQETSRISAKFNETKRVVGSSNQFHSFLCSATDEEHIYLVYCGKMFGFEYHTFPSYIIVLDWDGQYIDSYRYNRWVHYISPSSQPGSFYLTVYADDDSQNASMKLVKVGPKRIPTADENME